MLGGCWQVAVFGVICLQLCSIVAQRTCFALHKLCHLRYVFHAYLIKQNCTKIYIMVMDSDSDDYGMAVKVVVGVVMLKIRLVWLWRWLW